MKWEGVLYGAAGFLVVAAILAFFIWRKTRSAWTGYVEDRYVDDDDNYTDYYVVFRTDRGRRVKIKVFEGMYDEFRPGDRVAKQSGVDWPNKLP
ncbi:MAG: hypothetical protein HPY50_00215 [Firmicutes bacterium]|nr:hypothetical protein [Bacillota bacterium]